MYSRLWLGEKALYAFAALAFFFKADVRSGGIFSGALGFVLRGGGFTPCSFRATACLIRSIITLSGGSCETLVNLLFPIDTSPGEFLTNLPFHKPHVAECL